MSEKIELIVDDVCIGVVVFHVVCEYADIHDVVIIPSFRGKGYGLKLMSDFLSKMKQRGVKLLTLEVRVDNVTAISLYEKFGFDCVSVRKGYYKDGCDALLMQLEI